MHDAASAPANAEAVGRCWREMIATYAAGDAVKLALWKDVALTSPDRALLR